MEGTRRGRRQRAGALTWNFHVHAHAPVDGVLRAVDVEVSEAHLAHARAHRARLLVARHAHLLPARRPVRRREEVVDEVQVLVRDLQRGLLDLELVQELVEVLVLPLRGGRAQHSARAGTGGKTGWARAGGSKWIEDGDAPTTCSTRTAPQSYSARGLGGRTVSAWGSTRTAPPAQDQ